MLQLLGPGIINDVTYVSLVIVLRSRDYRKLVIYPVIYIPRLSYVSKREGCWGGQTCRVSTKKIAPVSRNREKDKRTSSTVWFSDLYDKKKL